MTMIDTIREAQARSLEQIRTAQEQVVEFNERIADTMLGAMPDVRSPFAAYLPKPTEMVSAYYEFVGDLQKANADFAMRLAQAWETDEPAQA